MQVGNPVQYSEAYAAAISPDLATSHYQLYKFHH